MNILDGMLNNSSLNNTGKAKVIYLPADELLANKNNFYEMNEIDGLKSNIEDGGLLQPIIVNKIEDQYIIHTGHRRVAALRLLFEENKEVNYFGRILEHEVPCIVKDSEDSLKEKISMMRSNAYRNFSPEEKEKIVKEAHQIYQELEELGQRPKGREREWINSLTGISDGTVKTILSEMNRNSEDDNISKDNKVRIFNFEKSIKSLEKIIEDFEDNIMDIDYMMETQFITIKSSVEEIKKVYYDNKL